MSSAVDRLKQLFYSLNEYDKKEVLRFLYGGKGQMLVEKGSYVGPIPGAITEGLYVGPAPSASGTCPMCGRPLA